LSFFFNIYQLFAVLDPVQIGFVNLNEFYDGGGIAYVGYQNLIYRDIDGFVSLKSSDFQSKKIPQLYRGNNNDLY
jgi:hypothetical protein